MAMKLGDKRLQRGWLLVFGVFCFVGLVAAPSRARVLESTNGPRLTVGPAGHAYTRDELAKKEAGKSEAKQQKTAASESGPKESPGKE
ncbi:hypothetical protein [Methylacidimicrobium sp. B4]|uniref:hypothetical protein n=1 Tax=Methylacidimicrobium sp. B4 TaxID=2796139 RepID=UPI001A8ED80A|nr:hypothetical protein [Methylacidimicrobium sp. B4]QSR85187.1 hypothetical protein MacB4_02690 [Methylacidimicrobium sp. B4]